MIREVVTRAEERASLAVKVGLVVAVMLFGFMCVAAQRQSERIEQPTTCVGQDINEHIALHGHGWGATEYRDVQVYDGKGSPSFDYKANTGGNVIPKGSAGNIVDSAITEDVTSIDLRGRVNRQVTVTSGGGFSDVVLEGVTWNCYGVEDSPGHGVRRTKCHDLATGPKQRPSANPTRATRVAPRPRGAPVKGGYVAGVGRPQGAPAESSITDDVTRCPSLLNISNIGAAPPGCPTADGMFGTAGTLNLSGNIPLADDGEFGDLVYRSNGNWKPTK